jgi:hypothetical protein
VKELCFELQLVAIVVSTFIWIAAHEWDLFYMLILFYECVNISVIFSARFVSIGGENDGTMFHTHAINVSVEVQCCIDQML